ncbi:PTS transporter subunit EIIB [Spiroplasma turonicum]|uniref:PTS system trehalose-specific IIBC component n=1 Tax=Spiroplasma turonicum TaxID=216946 RepID=A0A0K1P629_9MOLU|nr:PTS transporter subunit EIIB [Spiroplasma turonicum]AKU79768.1 PTS system trehalose-specific IIBC component [Spiroplasma turonicum]ALX70786.1 PTS system, trehalose-specific IIBC component [Spiroplasma turonicum]
MRLFSKKKDIDENIIIIADLLGNSENIENISHCSTRMRIKVKDATKIRLDELKNNDLISGVIINDNLIQFVVRKNIEDFNKDFLTSIGLSVKRIPNLFDVKLSSKKGFFKTLTDGIGILVMPIIPYLITLSIVSTFENIVNGIEVNGSKISDTGEFAETLGNILKTLQKSLALAFSILIPWSIFKLMKGSEAIGISIGVVLCAKDLATTNDFMGSGKPLFDWGSSGNVEGTAFDWSFSNLTSGYPWKISYEGQILPLVMIGFMAVYLERLVRKIKFGVIKELLGIPSVLIIAFFVGQLLLAPIGMLITFGMNKAVLWATTHSIAKFIFNPMFALLLPWLVVTGFIQIFVVVALQQFMTYNATSINPMFTQLNVSVATSVLAFAIMNRKNKELQKTAVPSYLIAFVGGSTEPALFGVALRFLFPVIAVSIGTMAGVIITTASGVLTTMGPCSLLVFLTVIPQAADVHNGFDMTTWAGTGFLWMAIALAVTISTTFLVTILLSRINYFKKMTKNILDRDFSPIPGAEIETKKNKLAKTVK